jgi:hypothetical protein
MTDIIRTRKDGCYRLKTNAWGSFIARCDDPLAEATLDKGAMDRFELNDGIAVIPADLWSRWVKLCFHFTGKVRNEVEVSCRLLRHEDDKSQWRILVPAQRVDGASVRVESFDEAIDIATGEVIASYPPEGWVPCGSSHSHNTMAAFFSGTDDRYELGDPGVHIVVGSIDTNKMEYRIASSITASNRRFLVPFDKLLDATAIPDAHFHPDVLKLIDHSDLRPATFIGQAPQWPGTSLHTHPNAGNGYNRQDLGDDPLWWGLEDSSAMSAIKRRAPNAADTYDHPLCNQIIEHVNAQLFRGQDEAVVDLLWELEDLVEHLQSELSAIEHDVHADATDCTVGAHSTTAGRIPAGEW